MKLGTHRFAPGFWPTLGAALLVFLTLFLARWQTDRGDEKQARQSLYESRMREPAVELRGNPSGEELLYRHVRARGEYVAAGQIYIDNQVFEGRAGFLVVTPLELAAGGELLVQRGWIERDSRYPAAPEVAVPAGPVQVSGIASLPPRRYLELSSETITGNVWQNLSLERYGARAGAKVLPFVLVDDVAGAGLKAIHERPDTGIERHREYALTWYAFAATALGLWVALGMRPKR